MYSVPGPTNWIMMERVNREKPSAREAYLVCILLEAGRNIEQTIYTLGEVSAFQNQNLNNFSHKIITRRKKIQQKLGLQNTALE